MKKLSLNTQTNIKIFGFFILIVVILAMALTSFKKVAGTVTYYYYGSQIVFGNESGFRIAEIISNNTALTFNFWAFLMWVLLPLGAGVVGLVKFKNVKLQMAICCGCIVASLIMFFIVPNVLLGHVNAFMGGMWVALIALVAALGLYGYGLIAAMTKGYEA